MLNYVRIKNFRKHRSAEFQFTTGLNCIRGSNESGKTTITEAILYAFFGSDALRESIALVVTEGEPENSLQVIVSITFNGVEYAISRGPSGAEILYGDQRVTGQTVTKVFMENLFGAAFKVTSNLMFADQNAIRGVLEQGSAANGLVEKLADLDVIEVIIDKIQTQLPTGNVTQLDLSIAAAEEQLKVMPEKPSDSEVVRLTQEFEQAQRNFDLTKASAPADQEVVQAQGTVEACRALQADLARFESKRDEVVALLAIPVTEPAFSESDLTRARAEAADFTGLARRLKAYTQKFPTASNEWEGTLESLDQHIKSLQEADKADTKTVQTLQTERQVKLTKKINEKSCAFCQKDLSDVPEVAVVNAALDSEVQAIEQKLVSLYKQIADRQPELQACEEIRDVHGRICLMISPEFWELGTTIPAKPAWKGEVPVETADPGAKLKTMETAWKAYQQKLTEVNFKKVELANLNNDIVGVQLKLAEVDQQAAASIIQQGREKQLKVTSAQQALTVAEQALQAEKRVYANSVSHYESAIQLREAAAKNLEDSKTLRAKMLANNELIKKLRAARPKIAAQMWSTVLGAISHYFTQIRGTSSVVTREATGFKVNGRGTAGLSGSTLDALGLSIRMSLSKLFLPNVPMLCLDESFSGADDDRELAGIGTLAGAGFQQVLLVTHSSLPEAVADNLIVL